MTTVDIPRNTVTGTTQAVVLTVEQTRVVHPIELGEWFAEVVMGKPKVGSFAGAMGSLSKAQNLITDRTCYGPSEDPSFRLLTTVVFGGTHFHAEAIRVTTSESGEQVPDVRDGCDYDSEVEILDAWRSIDPGYWHTISYYPFAAAPDTKIEYVMLIHPFVE